MKRMVLIADAVVRPYAIPVGLGRTPSREAAEALYVGLATDTGWFRYASAGPQAFRDAADLVAAGAYPPRVYELVYENLSWPRTRLLARPHGRLL